MQLHQSYCLALDAKPLDFMWETESLNIPGQNVKRCPLLFWKDFIEMF